MLYKKSGNPASASNPFVSNQPFTSINLLTANAAVSDQEQFFIFNSQPLVI
jgi:hypothetical protein